MKGQAMYIDIRKGNANDDDDDDDGSTALCHDLHRVGTEEPEEPEERRCAVDKELQK